MKITRIEQIKVAVPYVGAIQKYRPSEHVDRPILLIKMETDEGIVGLGDGGRDDDVSAEIPLWIGRDPLSLPRTLNEYQLQQRGKLKCLKFFCPR